MQPLPQRTGRDLGTQHAGTHGYPRSREPGRSPAGDRIRVGDGVDHRPHSGFEQGVHARRSLAVVVARLESDHGDGACRQPAGTAQRHHLGMVATGRLGRADADHQTVGVNDDGPDRWIRIGGALDLV